MSRGEIHAREEAMLYNYDYLGQVKLQYNIYQYSRYVLGRARAQIRF